MKHEIGEREREREREREKERKKERKKERRKKENVVISKSNSIYRK
jgi:hypothetical protein